MTAFDSGLTDSLRTHGSNVACSSASLTVFYSWAGTKYTESLFVSSQGGEKAELSSIQWFVASLNEG